MALIVAFRGQEVHRESIHESDPSLTVSDFLRGLCEANGVAVEYSKLVYRGRVLTADDEGGVMLLRDAVGYVDGHDVADVKVLLIGTASEEVESLLDVEQRGVAHAKTIRNDFDEAATRAQRERKLQSGLYKRYEDKRSAPSPYRFQQIRTLPGLPDEDRARRVLEELANDPGVLRVMETRRWTVGSLSELYPEGVVGVSDVCILGLNKNKGQEILLRIRTDDLSSFRKVHMLRDVLFHELAHNVHSEHDDKFTALMNEIKREASEMDWRRQRGRTADGRLAGPGNFERAPAGMAQRSEQTMIIRDLSGRRGPSAYPGTSGGEGRRLGDVSEERKSVDVMKSSERMDVQEEEEYCGFVDCPCGKVHMPFDPSAFKGGEEPEEERHTALQREANATSNVVLPTAPQHSGAQPSSQARPSEASVESGVSEEKEKEEAPQPLTTSSAEKMEIAETNEIVKNAENAEGPSTTESEAGGGLSSEEEAMLAASLADMGPAGERLRIAVDSLSVATLSSAKIVLRMLSNIMGAPGDARFHQVRETNLTVARKVLGVPGAVDVLEASGFTWRGVSPNRELAWTRRDIALLFVAKALLELRIANLSS